MLILFLNKKSNFVLPQLNMIFQLFFYVRSMFLNFMKVTYFFNFLYFFKKNH